VWRSSRGGSGGRADLHRRHRTPHRLALARPCFSPPRARPAPSGRFAGTCCPPRQNTRHTHRRIGLPAHRQFDDLDPLAGDPAARLTWCRAGSRFPKTPRSSFSPAANPPSLTLLTCARKAGTATLQAHLRRGGRIFGICGGYQMLGQSLADPEGIEGPPAMAQGLGLLALHTRFTRQKTLAPWQGTYEGAEITGYEMHLGVSEGPALARPLFHAASGREGARSEDGLVSGTYLHGIFANDSFRRHLLAQLGAPPSAYAYRPHLEQILEGWADVLESALSIDKLLSLAQPVPHPPQSVPHAIL